MNYDRWLEGNISTAFRLAVACCFGSAIAVGAARAVWTPHDFDVAFVVGSVLPCVLSILAVLSVLALSKPAARQRIGLLLAIGFLALMSIGMLATYAADGLPAWLLISSLLSAGTFSIGLLVFGRSKG